MVHCSFPSSFLEPIYLTGIAIRHRAISVIFVQPFLIGSNYWRNRVLKVAKDFKNQAYFAVASKAEQRAALEEVGLGSATGDVLVAARGEKEEKFPMSGKFRLVFLSSYIHLVSLLWGFVNTSMYSLVVCTGLYHDLCVEARLPSFAVAMHWCCVLCSLYDYLPLL